MIFILFFLIKVLFKTDPFSLQILNNRKLQSNLEYLSKIQSRITKTNIAHCKDNCKQNN